MTVLVFCSKLVLKCFYLLPPKTNSKLYLNLLEMECSGDVTQNQAEVLVCFDRAIRSPMPLDTLVLFAQRKVEFLEDFGTDINT